MDKRTRTRKGLAAITARVTTNADDAAISPEQVAKHLFLMELARAGAVISDEDAATELARAGGTYSDDVECQDKLIVDDAEDGGARTETGLPMTAVRRVINRMQVRQAAAEDGPSHVVVREIGDATSKGGRELVQRYASAITQPLPLRGVAPDPKAIKDALLEWCPWSDTAAQTIASSVALASLSTRGGITLRPLLLVGPPGSGKSGLAAKAASLLDLPSRVMPCGGLPDHGGILATARGWSTSQPSSLFLTAFETRCANPMMVFDEVDKSASAASMDSKNGTVTGALISLLSNPSAFWDDCLLTMLDVSRFSFAVTVNTLKTLPNALLDRFTVVELQRPEKRHFEAILSNAIQAEADSLGLPTWAMPDLDALDRKVLLEMWLDCGRSIRVLKRALATIVGQKAMERPRAN